MDTEYLRKLLEGQLVGLRLLAEDDHPEDLLEIHHYVGREILHIAAAADALIPGHGKEIVQMLDDRNYVRLQDLILQALHEIDHAEALQRALGPGTGPTLHAASFHPIVWGACASLWRSNHRREAINLAAVAVNAALQDRVGRRDCSNADLWTDTLKNEPPVVGKPRLRVHPEDGSETYRSMQEGAMSFGRGCLQALRNTGSAHTLGDEPTEHEALEQLAAFSIMARWVESGEVIYAPDKP